MLTEQTYLVGFQNMQAKNLTSHDFSCYLVCYQKLLASHIWFAKSMAIFLSNFWLAKSWMSTKQAPSTINISFMKNKERLNVENKENLLTYVSRFPAGHT